MIAQMARSAAEQSTGYRESFDLKFLMPTN